MKADQTPFPSAWWGQGLDDVRPDVGTYGRYGHDALPSLPFRLRGDFGWLRDRPPLGGHVGEERSLKNEVSLPRLITDAAARGVELPSEFVAFFRSPELWQRLRSCTDCFLDLSPVCVASPLADGFLVRFLADSQGCVFWYLYQRPGSADHCVVASTDFYGAEAEAWQDAPPDPANLVFAEESFEAFLCRFWLENEIWFCGYEERPMFAEGQRYIDAYGSKP
jgi:hypothetical protein